MLGQRHFITPEDLKLGTPIGYSVFADVFAGDMCTSSSGFSAKVAVKKFRVLVRDFERFVQVLLTFCILPSDAQRFIAI